MTDRLIRKLTQRCPLSQEDTRAIQETFGNPRMVEAGATLVHEGDALSRTTLVSSGWAYCYKEHAKGKRQIVEFLLPGDIHNLGGSAFGIADCTLVTLTPISLYQVPAARIQELVEQRSQIAQAVRATEETRTATLREVVLVLGAHSAFERLAHLLYSLYLRLRAVDLAVDMQCEMPLTQYLMAEAIGMTSVHVNRSLHAMRAAGLISLSGKQLTILNFAGLQAAAQFSASYWNILGASGPLPESERCVKTLRM
jgi:CRP-like cAMP-binding protein